MKKQLTLADLLVQTKKFAASHPKLWFPETYAVTDGKAIGTFIEHKFREYLQKSYAFEYGNSALGIDFPELELECSY